MELAGKQSIAAPRQVVWDALNNPEVLKKCLPGCESVTRTAPDEFAVVVTTSVGPLRARFNGSLQMTQVDAPHSCVLVFQGQGGAIGFGKGASQVELTESPAGCELSYSAKAEVGGKIAQIGSRLIDSVARKMSDDFFQAFHRALVPEPAIVASVQPEVVAASPLNREELPGVAVPGSERGLRSKTPTWATVAWAAATSFSAGVALASLVMAGLMALRH